MENIVVELGSAVCHAVTHLSGSGQAICYNSSSSATVGYSVILGLALILAFRKIFSQAGG